MANDEQVARLQHGVDEWNRWRRENHAVTIDLSRANLSRADLIKADLSVAYLSGADLSDAYLVGADLSGADLSGAHLREAYLSRSDLRGADLRRADLRVADLSGTNLLRADLSGADLSGANLSNANLSNANLSGANLYRAQLVNSKWENAKLDGSSDLSALRYTAEHDAFNDGTNTLRLPRRLRLLQWSAIRGIGQFPLFSVSWFGLISSLLVLNSMGWWNNNLAKEFSEGLPLIIPIPNRLIVTLFGALLLVIGTSLYRFGCPTTVQDFSESEWVVQYGRPRLMYLAESFSRFKLRIATLVFLLLGGLLAIYLVALSLIDTLSHIWLQWSGS